MSTSLSIVRLLAGHPLLHSPQPVSSSEFEISRHEFKVSLGKRRERERGCFFSFFLPVCILPLDKKKGEDGETCSEREEEIAD